ncbi:MAG: glycosyltransferase family 4 protein [Chloroflexi bacterium]|nr:glycosyltransferase family 4 protein [Chloroflexota bacterium]MCY4248192.1 glycosyltransferase family 4 protein [Chloroflexota bacterium]
MRIGLLTAELNRANGWATYSANLVEGLQALGIQTIVASARNSPATSIKTQPLLPTLTPPDSHSLARSLRWLPRLRTIFRGCDVIHATAEPYAILAAALAGKRPLFITAHGSYINLPRMRRFPMGSLYRRAMQRARLICVSRHTANVAEALLPGVSTAVINNGVDAARFASPAPEVDKQAPTVLTTGGIKPRKGTLQLVEAMAVARETLPAAQCVILGDPGDGSVYTTRLRRRIDELDLAGHVRILGFVDEAIMRAWLAAADVVALPAVNDGLFFEGFGLALLEAGAAGTAVVGTDNCGVADAIIHGETGLIVAQKQLARELPQALVKLLSDPARAAAMGAAGKKHAQTQTWQSVAAQVSKLYQAALG